MLREKKRDYYEVLGVARDADEPALKRAYRKLAVQYHPDHNPGSAEAESRFREAVEAYRVLSNPERRAVHDGRFRYPGDAGAAPGLLTRLRSIRIIPYAITAVTALLLSVSLITLGGFLARKTAPDSTAQQSLVNEVIPSPPFQRKRMVQAVSKKRAAHPAGTVTVVRGARPIRRTELEYSADALRERLSGLVELQLTIAGDGSVESPRVLSGHPLLAQGLPEAVSRWKFQPMRVNGRPAPMTTEIAIRFDIVK